MTELRSFTQNHATKLDTYTKRQIILQVSSGKSHYLQNQGYPPYLLKKKLIFQEVVPPYQKTLRKSGYRHTLTYKRSKNDNNNTNIKNIKLNRERQIKWLNPLFNLKTKTKIGKLFLNPLEKHFPPLNKLHRLFNRTNVKISYNSMSSTTSDAYMH